MFCLKTQRNLKSQISNLKIKIQNLKLIIFWVFFLFGLFWGTNFVLAQEKEIVVADGAGQIIFYNLDGDITSSFYLQEGFLGPVSMAVGDVNGDFENEIVVMAKESGGVAIFSKTGFLEKSLPGFSFVKGKEQKFSFAPLYKRGDWGDLDKWKELILGDLDDDGKEEIIAAGSPYVKIFNYQGKLKEKFIPFSKNFRQELKLAVGDIDRDRQGEIVFLSNEHTDRMFVHKKKKIFSLPFEFKASNFSISLGDLEGDGKAEFGICDFTANSNCQISFFNHRNIVWPNNLIFKNNLDLKLEDVDNDGRAEAIVAEEFDGRISIYKINSVGSILIWKTIYSQNISDVDIFFEKTKIEGKVIYIDDGDTIFLDSGQEIRYIGVDTPEIGEPFYLEATNKNKELVSGKTVTLEFDKQKIDLYGRHLAYVFVDGIFVNKELIKAGLAKTDFIYPDVKYAKRLARAEKEAKILK
jgi:hypothetical protein